MQGISLDNALKGEGGINGLETAIVLIAFVLVGASFALTVFVTGLFSVERASGAGAAGLMAIPLL